MTTAENTNAPSQNDTVIAVLTALSVCHLLNDMMQSLLPSIYPILKDSYQLDFSQIGFITLAFQLTASLLQPVVGMYTDRYPKPYSAAIGMGMTVVGLGLIATANSYPLLLAAAAFVGVGSSIFHPESSRVARLASGGRHGFAQSLFQVGGNVGSAIGPLLAALIILPNGQKSVAWFMAAGIVAMGLLTFVGRWYATHGRARVSVTSTRAHLEHLSSGRIKLAIAVLVALVFSKFVYMASLGNYFTFYLIDTFGVSVHNSQLYLFVFLAAVAAGTFLGGPLGDYFGRKYVIWFSIVGALPFTLALPYANLEWTLVLAIIIGLIMSSAFSAIVVFAQELVPGRTGMIAGLFFGLAFGMGGLGAAILGEIADLTSIGYVYQICSFLPLIGLVTWFLPNIEGSRRRAKA
ncbi:MFS transporter [Aestuariivirga sp. YIM B02566]|uniref:MFS transporter n=1 Tax=Taklimakanibacter albus TaxID=2800327 RepID=A0ACC5QX53_9HYPH|nr:MFS transporter [Aestuariivirga sp. YIM B02566]